MTHATVLGSGSFGTALAIHLCRRGHDVTLWGWAQDEPEALDAKRENARYLPGLALPPRLRVTGDMASCCSKSDLVVIAVPSSAMREVATAAAPHLAPGALLVSATKGLEPRTHLRMSEVLRQVLPPAATIAALSGPSFAREVAMGLPTTAVIACEDIAVARRIQELISDATFRAYASSDVIGVELGGALKNAIAIAAGMISGLDLGHDASAALVTRGLREMSELGVAMGARRSTFNGLSGLGDLVLTCTGAASRNRRLGEMLAKGLTLDEARQELGQVSEGVETCQRAIIMAARHGVSMPIMSAVRDVLFNGTPPLLAVEDLMCRPLEDEDDG